MVDNFALALTHGLLALAAWRLFQRTDLDRDLPPAESAPAVKPETPPRGAPRRMVVKPLPDA